MPPDITERFRKNALWTANGEMALAFARMYGTLRWYNISGEVEDEGFELALYEKYQGYFSPKNDSGQRAVDWLHVVSDVYDVGGHTRLLEHLIRYQRMANAAVSVISTRRLTRRFRQFCLGQEVSARALNGSSLNRIRSIIAAGRNAKFVILHSHPDDILAALAARQLREEGVRVFFLNHADHVFSFGVGASDAVLEVSGYGWRMTKARRNANAQHFLGIPVETVSTEMLEQASPDAPLLTVGASRKYKPRGELDFPKFANSLLEQTKRQLIVIGPDGAETWWSELRSKYCDRVVFLGRLPYSEMKRHLMSAACYIDSFPVSGGTIFNEALAQGKVVFGPPNPSAGYGLADVARSTSVSELTKDVVRFLKTGIVPKNQLNLTNKLRNEFSEYAVGQRLDAACGGCYQTPPSELLATPSDLDCFNVATPVEIPLPRRSELPWYVRVEISRRILQWHFSDGEIDQYIAIRDLGRWMLPSPRL